MARTRADEIAQALGRAAGGEPSSSWRRHYDPDTAEQLAGELTQIEAELDDPAGYPQWRDKWPFHDLTPAKAEWIKLRLKRIDLIVHGKAHLGMRVSYRKTSWSKRWPVVETVNPRGDLSRPPYRPVVWVNHVARQLGCTPRQVNAALLERPPGQRAVVPWIDEWLQRQAERRPAPSPPAAAPPAAHPSVPAPTADKVVEVTEAPTEPQGEE